MTTLAAPVQSKLEELCLSILAQPDFEAHRLRVDQFMVNDEAKSQYVRVSEQGEHLQHKRMQGVELTPEEIADFEQQREALLTNPVARGFLDAQEAMHSLARPWNWAGYLKAPSFRMTVATGAGAIIKAGRKVRV
jgi:cell fate (sporulation/competence/biofilm development) regulator YlbF (YheA/YmcA/DUF963 family)